MPYDVRIQLHPGAIQELLYSPTGAVGTFIQRLGMDIIARAKTNVPVKTGRLRDSIKVTLWPGPGNSIEISATAPYALAVHQGTKPHEIKGNPMLKFPSKKFGGKVIVVPKVQNRGSKANPFLDKAMASAVRSLR